MPKRAELNAFTNGRSVATDWVDLRDLRYQPSLAVLPDQLIPKVGSGWPGFAIRNQGESNTCVGHALANLIDLQRRQKWQGNGADAARSVDIVSADMLYETAAYHDEYPDLEKELRDTAQKPDGKPRMGVRSLRSAIKAFYHHGVCRDHPTGTPPPADCWQSDFDRADRAARPQRLPTVAQTKAARAISLGAYYRLEPVLNDYHAALNDTGGILVSAQVHRGWHAPFEPNTSAIADHAYEFTGNHAFVIVGYDARGFLVLNSWGDEWGGYQGLKGVALWPYADWAETVIDGWVLRLGVSAPDAFDATVGRRGLAHAMGTIRAGGVRCYQLIGHYLHLDDGFHVEHGSFPSDHDTWGVTRDHLRNILVAAPNAPDVAPPRKGILLWIPGSLEGIDPAARAAVDRKGEIATLDLYPYNVFWCNQFAEKSLEVMTSIFDSCLARVGARGPQLDALIEQQLRGVGRAFWRDIEQAARRAVHGTPDLPEEIDDNLDDKLKPLIEPGPLVEMFCDMLELAAAPGCELHVVCEGAGVLVLHELLRFLRQRDRIEIDALCPRLTSLSLIHPVIGLPRGRRHVLQLIAEMNRQAGNRKQTPVRATEQPRRSSRQAPPPARIFLPGPDLEKRLCLGAYGGSLLQLVGHLLCPSPLMSGSE
jgi:hypothetical protein